MSALFFYLTYPLVYLVAILPFSVLYKFSDFLYYIIRLSGYRRKVVLQNLTNSFPEKSPEEINSICEAYYRYLCDLVLETLKTLKMTPEEAKARCVFHQAERLDKIYAENKSIIIVMSHYGNWEWAGPSFSLNLPFQLVVVYRPLANPYFEKMLSGMRTRHGTMIIPVHNTLRGMVANRNIITATALVADQTATKKGAYWMEFLNQDTAVFTGPEKLSKKFNSPVVFMGMKRPRRGYYEIMPELLFADPQNTAENEITETFTHRIEQSIKEDPTIWLWSHKRWKHKRDLKSTSA